MTNLTQGRRPQQNERNTSIAIFGMIALFAMAVMLVITKSCHAQTDGYFIVTQQKGKKVQTHKVNTTAAADSLMNAVCPGFDTAATLQATVYWEQETQHSYVYIERKAYVRTKSNGKLKLRRIKG